MSEVDTRHLAADDVVGNAQTLAGVRDLIERLGVVASGAVVAMRQGRARCDALGPARRDRVLGMSDAPVLGAARGWRVAGPDRDPMHR